MAETRKLVRVFIASPSDLRDERVIAKSVVDEFNNIWADTLGYQVELVGWEDAVSVFGRPQSVINKDLERCELFVGLLWKRWGTPPDNLGNYSSGFEEEFVLSVERRKKIGKPEISLFFKDILPDLLIDPGQDLKKVLKFKDDVSASKELLFEKFLDSQEFQTKFRRCISNYVKLLHAVESKNPVQEAKQSSAVIESAGRSAHDEAFPEKARKFVTNLLAAERQSVSRLQVARLRLLGQISATAGNDQRTIGVHDANILFLERAAIDLSDREIDGLVECGFEHFADENCPVWYWLNLQRALQRSWMPIFAAFGTVNVRCGAFDAMRLIAEPINDSSIPRKRLIEGVLSKESESRLKVAALKYLEGCGVEADLEFIRAELARDDHQTRQWAIRALLRILLNDSRERALQVLLELQADSVDERILGELFVPGARFDRTMLSGGLSSRSAAVRLAIIRQLRSQDSFSPDIAEALLTDGSTKIRLEALLSLVDAGRQFSDEQARRILIQPSSNFLFGGGSGGFDKEGTDAYETFRSAHLAKLTKLELDKVVQSASVYDDVPFLTRSERFFEEYGGELRSSVTDEFVEYFGDTLSRMANSGWTESQIEQARSLSDYIRRRITRKGLDIICSKASAGDLSLVRAMLNKGFVPYSRHDIDYLQRFGDWNDIALIVSDIERTDYGVSVLLFDTSRYDLAARAIYSVGKGRFSELLAMSAPPQLVSKLILISSDKEFRAVSDTVIDNLLLSKHDVVRKSVALKCGRSLSKRRLRNILTRYSTTGTYQYYNVLHWLDFGLSMPKDRVISGVDRAVAAMG